MRISDWSSDVCSSDLDELRADDDIDQPALDIVDEFGGFRGRPQGVRSDDRDARLGKAQRDLVGDALDARTAGDEAILILALGAEPRPRQDRKSGVVGKGVSVEVDLGGRRTIKKKR